jgi:hypothetical protein
MRVQLKLDSLHRTGLAGSGLTSPFRQMFHVLGLLLAVPTDEARDINDKDWTEVLECLETVFGVYALMYFPSEQHGIEDAQWATECETAMPAFLHYFNTPALLYRDQIVDRIRRWATPFSSAIQARTGLTIERLVEMVAACEELSLERQKRLLALHESADRERHDFLDLAERGDWGLDRMRLEAQTHPVKDATLRLFEAMDKFSAVDIDALRQRFGTEAVDAFLSLFVGNRGGHAGYRFPTDPNPAELRCLFRGQGGDILLPVRDLARTLLNVVMSLLTNDPDTRGGFLAHRDRAAETQVAELFTSYLGVGGTVLRNVSESPDGQHEHDTVILTPVGVLIVEVKATPPNEPFRDPARAYKRIRGDFRSDGGIQKAFEQANRLRRRIDSGESVTLYDCRGQAVATISDSPAVQCICVTADSFGIVATDLSLLLEKDPADPYPWAVSIPDLDVFLQILSHKGRGVDEVFRFLSERSELHGRVTFTDELEAVGAFLQSGSLRELPREGARVFLSEDCTDIIDNLYFEIRGLPIPYPAVKEGHGPFATDVTNELKQLLGRQAPMVSETVERVGRNDPCPCRSGRKYKRCHGR